MKLFGKIVLCIIIVFIMYFVFVQVMYLCYQQHYNRQTTILAKQVVSQLKKTTNGTNGNTYTNWTGEAEVEKMNEAKK